MLGSHNEVLLYYLDLTWNMHMEIYFALSAQVRSFACVSYLTAALRSFSNFKLLIFSVLTRIPGFSAYNKDLMHYPGKNLRFY